MSKREAIIRYYLIVKKLRKFPATFEEIADYLEKESELQGYDFNISIRTFQRDVKDIEVIFQMEIRFDFSRKLYYLNVQEQPEVYERFFEAFDTFNAFNLSERLSENIHFEKRRPQGTENLYGLLHAIKNSLCVQFNYQKFWEEIISHRIVEPLALKEFKNRWYLVAKDKKDLQIKTFALDRLSDLEIGKTRFDFPPDFNLNRYFKYSFGIMSPIDQKPEKVLLSFTPFQGKYIKSLPLHPSQIVVKDDKNEVLIELNLFVTHDFLMELLSFGENLKVIAPKSLIEDVKSVFQNALEHY